MRKAALDPCHISPSKPKRRWFVAAVALFSLLGAGVLGAGVLVSSQRRSSARTAPAWDRPDSTEEERLLQRALDRSGDGEAQAALGRYYLSVERPFEALWAFQRAREVSAVSPSTGNGPAITLAMAGALEKANLRARALELLTQAVSRYGDDRRLALRRAELQLRLGRPEAALVTLRSLEDEPSETAPEADPGGGPTPPVQPAGDERSTITAIRLLRGRALEAAGNDAAALAEYQRCLAINPAAHEGHLRLGRLLVRLGRVADGRARLEAAHRQSPHSPEPAYWLGMSFMAMEAADPAPARAWLTEALRARADYGPAYVALGRMCVRHRYWKVATQQFTQALQKDPWDSDALLGLAGVLKAVGHPLEAHRRRGLAYVAQGKLPQALAEFRAMKAAQPGNRAASILISQTLIAMMLNADAARELAAAAPRYPRDWDLKERLAQLALITHTPDLVRQICTEWLKVDPSAPKALWLLGRVALVAPDLPQAIDYFERAARLAPQDPEIVFALGEALSRPGPGHSSSRAMQLLARAVELAPREPRYRYHLGLLLQQLSHLEPARRQYLRALDLDPQMTAAYLGLVQLSGRLGEAGQIGLLAPVIRDQQEAAGTEPRLRRRIYRSPGDPAGYKTLARYLADRGDLKGARAQWEVVASLKPNDTEARRALARLNRILDVW